MEIFGGFMVMMSIIGFFLAVIWLIMPFVVFAIKGKQDRTVEVMERIEKRLSEMDSRLAALQRQVDRLAEPEPVAHVSDITPPDQVRTNEPPAS
jgi:cytochrome b subunit of formate dehydrogenase